MPRLLKKASQHSSPPSVKEPGLVAVDDLPLSRRPYGSRNIVFGMEGRVSTQAGVFAQVLSPDRNVQADHRHIGEGVGGEHILDSEDSSEEDVEVMDDEPEGGGAK